MTKSHKKLPEVVKDAEVTFIGGPADGTLMYMSQLPQILHLPVSPSARVIYFPDADSIIQPHMAVYNLITGHELSLEGVSTAYGYFYLGEKQKGGKK